MQPGQKLKKDKWMKLSKMCVMIPIEPMVNAGGAAIQVLPDGWTVKTQDGKWAAHYENTICITDGKPEILTALDASWEEYGWKL